MSTPLFPLGHVMMTTNLQGKVQEANPELDQISGRFSHRRGEVGLLVCRELRNKDLFIERCRDTVRDDRGYIIPLDDEDLRALVEEAKNQGIMSQYFGVLGVRFKRLVM